MKAKNVQWSDEKGAQHAIARPASIEVRSKLSQVLVTAGGVRTPVVPPARWAYDLALIDTWVADALRLLGSNAELDYFVLFKLFEIIEDDVGKKFVEKSGGNTKLKQFTASANHEELGGGEARHPRKRSWRTPDPNLYMSIPDSKRWLLGVAGEWIDSKL